jgi:predicted nucleotidyltransferase
VNSFPELRLVPLLRRLTEGHVDFVVIGGVAVALQGYGRSTKDLDITYATDPANLEALGAVLMAAGARLRGVAEDVPFIPDARTLKHTQILTLDTTDGGLDLLVDPSGAPPYETLRRRSEVVDYEGLSIRVVALDDLLSMKRAAHRPLDLVDIEALEAARHMTRRNRRRERR